MPETTPLLIPEVAAIAPQLAIFDKDGTLIDFHAMWGSWVTELARRLEQTTGRLLADRLFAAMGFDPQTGYVTPSGPLAVTPIAELFVLTRRVLYESSIAPQRLEAALRNAWHTPDPNLLARPLVDLTRLFTTLRANGLKIAIATSDDHAPTETMLATLGLTALVDVIVGADEGLPIKPAPDVIVAICRTLNIPPSRTIMVGDNVADLEMGRAAKVGVVIGVLSGVSTPDMLAPAADLILPTVNELLHSEI